MRPRVVAAVCLLLGVSLCAAQQPGPVRVEISPAYPLLPLLTSWPFTATAHYEDGTTADITGQLRWSSSDPSVVDFPDAGAPGLAYFYSLGWAEVVASYEDGTPAASTEVYIDTLTGLRIEPADAVVRAGGSQRFSALGLFEFWGEGDLTPFALWQSSDAGALQFSPQVPGLAAAGSGSSRVTVTAAFAGFAGAADVEVFDASISDPDQFTLILLPDTQYYAAVAHGGTMDMFMAQTEWVAAQRDALKIRAVVGLGDIVNCPGFAHEFPNADRAYRVLDEAGVPYLAVLGNHDYNHLCGRVGARITDSYNHYFGPARLAGYEWNGLSGYPSDKNDNHYITFENDGVPYLALGLEFAPRDAALEWARAVLDAYPEHRVIVSTHAFLTSNDPARADDADLGGPPPGFFEFTEPYNNGQKIWEKLISPSHNVILVVSGHYAGVPTHRSDRTEHGALIPQINADYQNDGRGGSGFLRVMRVRPSRGLVENTTYSPYLEAFESSPANDFLLRWEGTPPPPAGTPAADLRLGMTADRTALDTGEVLRYTLTAGNLGPDVAEDVIVSNNLPRGVELVAAEGPSGSCPYNGTILCPVGTLAAGQSAVVTIDVRPVVPGVLRNRAAVRRQPGDSRPGNNFAEVIVEAARGSADIWVSMADAPDPVPVGQPLTYTIQVGNRGPGAATLVTLTDTLPNLNFVSAVTTRGGCSGKTTVTCRLGTLEAGASATVVLVGRPKSAVLHSNTAALTAVQEDLNPDDNSASTQTTVVPSADLRLTATASAEAAYVGEVLTYTLKVTNQGPNAASAVKLAVTLPSGVTLRSVASTLGTCTGGSSPGCSLGLLPNQGSATVTLEVEVTEAGEQALAASISSQTFDAAPGNNGASPPVSRRVREADLWLVMSAAPDPVPVGQDLTYTIQVGNLGPGTATAVTLTDALPNLNFTSAAGTQGSCTGKNTVVCHLGTIAAGQSTAVVLVGRPKSAIPHVNTASVSALPPDPDTANNSASAGVTVVPASDLDLTLSASSATVLTGETVTYTATVRNLGPNAAAGVRMEVALPQGLTLLSLVTTRGTCSGAVCSLGSVPNQGTATVTAEAKAAAPGSGSAAFTLASLTFDPRLQNNSVSIHTTRVQHAADLWITMTAAPDPVPVGQPLTYTIQAGNHGPGTATLVTLTDSLPNLNFVSFTTTQGTCTGWPVVTCNLGTLQPGAFATVVLVGRPKSAVLHNNTASITAAQEDTNPTDNSASVATRVVASSDLRLTAAVSAEAAFAGEILTYTLAVTNLGPNAASASKLSLALPPGLELVSLAATQGTCSGTGNLACNLGVVPNQGGASVTLTARALVAGPADLAAAVSSITFDSNPANNPVVLRIIVSE